MASVDLAVTGRRDWALSNPWLWALPGAALCSGAWVASLTDRADSVVWSLIVPGLFMLGIAVTVRLSSNRDACLNSLAPESRSLVLLALGGIFGLMCVGMTGCLLGTIVGLPVGVPGIPWGFGQMIGLWLIIGPLTGLASLMCFRRAGIDATLTTREEAGAVLLLASFGLFCVARSLYDPANPLAWDTIRLFFGVFAAVAFVAAPLAVAAPTVRRVAISALIVVHFLGIFTATLSAPPFPWVVGQFWLRVYRPYLEFMYLNNAYHFYSPEPGPASYLWFRIIYTDAKNKEFGTWYKIPKIDDQGQHGNVVSLEYQRVLAVTENTVPADNPPQLFFQDDKGNMRMAGFYERRVTNSPLNNPVLNIGGRPKAAVLSVPFHPYMQHYQQYKPPTTNSLRLLQSYARRVAQMPHPDHPDWKFKSVKIYRVQHNIPPVSPYLNGLDPRDPELYQPLYLGEYDEDGELLNPETDPFLFWILPVLRKSSGPGAPAATERTVPITNWAIRHAGDPEWLFEYSELEKRYRPRSAEVRQ